MSEAINAEEIVAEYESSTHKSATIRSLAESTNSSPEEIRFILRENGVDGRRLPPISSNTASSNRKRRKSSNGFEVVDSITIEAISAYIQRLQVERQVLLDQLSAVESKLQEIAALCELKDDNKSQKYKYN